MQREKMQWTMEYVINKYMKRRSVARNTVTHAVQPYNWVKSFTNNSFDFI